MMPSYIMPNRSNAKFAIVSSVGIMSARSRDFRVHANLIHATIPLFMAASTALLIVYTTTAEESVTAETTCPMW